VKWIQTLVNRGKGKGREEIKWSRWGGPKTAGNRIKAQTHLGREKSQRKVEKGRVDRGGVDGKKNQLCFYWGKKGVRGFLVGWVFPKKNRRAELRAEGGQTKI